MKTVAILEGHLRVAGPVRHLCWGLAGLVGLVWRGLVDRWSLKGEIEELGGSAAVALVGFEGDSVARAWWRARGAAECLAGRADFRSVVECPVGPARV